MTIAQKKKRRSRDEKAPQPQYQIIKTESSLLISESRVSVLDVMEAYDAGDSIYDISMAYNLSPLQVKTALDYITQHRAALEPQLAKAVRLREERERSYRALERGLHKRVAHLPMTPQRAAFYALRKKNRSAEVQPDAVHPQ